MKKKLSGLAFSNQSAILFVVLFAVAAVFAENFFTVRNILNIARQSCVLGLVTVGVAFVLISGHMDLSVGGIVSFTGLIALSFQAHMPAGLAIMCALAVGGVCGLINGLIVRLTHANSGESLMITFGTQLVFSAASLLYTGGLSLPGSKSAFYNAIGMAVIGKYLPVPFLIFTGVAALLSVLQKHMVFGRKMHMIGYNGECCRVSGLEPGKTAMACYSISGLTAAAAAVVLTSRTMSATPTSGSGYEMDAIVAAVLGGISLSGGSGSVLKAFVGVLMLGVISNAMNLLGFQSHDQSIVKGCILVLAIAADVLARRRKA